MSVQIRQRGMTTGHKNGEWGMGNENGHTLHIKYRALVHGLSDQNLALSSSLPSSETATLNLLRCKTSKFSIGISRSAVEKLGRWGLHMNRHDVSTLRRTGKGQR